MHSKHFAAFLLSLFLLSGSPLFADVCVRALTPKYQSVKMDWRYRGEQFVPRVITKLNNYEVRYLKETEIDQLEVIHDGQKWVYKISGESITVPGEEFYLMVMDEYGRIYVGREGHIDGLHHSSVPRGGPLAAAGVVSFDSDGNIRTFTDDTGHYFRSFNKVPGLNWSNFLAELTARGVDTARVMNLKYDRSNRRKGLIDRILTAF